jgi:predicted porin
LSPDVLTASAQYTRTFNRRFSAFVNPSYTSIFDDGTDTRSNPAVRVGLRYRFGQLQ